SCQPLRSLLTLPPLRSRPHPPLLPLTSRPPPRSALFPYTTLFRSPCLVATFDVHLRTALKDANSCCIDAGAAARLCQFLGFLALPGPGPELAVEHTPGPAGHGAAAAGKEGAGQ